jgi:uncharacterized protein DUF4388
MPQSFEYNGDLAVTPLAEILATIHRYGVPGVVDITRGKRTRRIFVEDGLVVFAASNEKDLDLASYLLKQRALDPETAREAEARRARDGLRMGQVLLQMGVVTPERLNTAISGQIRAIVFDTIDWDAGDVRFEIGARRTADFVRVELPIPEVLVGGIRRAVNVRRLVKRLGSAVTVLEKTGGPPPALFSEAERRFYESVDGKRSLQQLCAHGPAALAENARTLYAFYCLGLLRKARGTAPGARKIQYRTEGGSLGK